MSLPTAPRWIAAVLVLCLASPLSVRAQTVEPHDSDTLDPGSQTPAASTRKPDLARTGELITTYTNQFRSKHQRGELKVNPHLTRAAQDFADYLAKTDTFSHTADGKRPSQRISEHGYQFSMVAENIAWEFDSTGYTTGVLARAFVTGWRHSPGHRRNMLDSDLDEIRVGVARSAKTGHYYAVQDFGRAKSKAIVFKITNEADATAHYTVDGKPFSIEPHYTVTHQRSRTAELDFQGTGGGDDEKEGDAIFHPRTGTHFTIRGGKDGGFRVDAQ
jgi:uncharacterized protein YkwD